MAPIPASSLPSRDFRSLPSLRAASRSLSGLARSTYSFSAKLSQLVKRQNDPSIIPSTYGSLNSGPSPGVVVGIVLGSVGGFLLILWLIYTCMNLNGDVVESEYTESVVMAERRKSHGSQRSRRVSETVEIRREASPPPIRVARPPPERVERVIVEESRETRRERSRAAESDEVVVIEEHDPPPRRSKTKREKEERRESGYRTVDPLAYGGAVGGRSERRSSRR